MCTGTSTISTYVPVIWGEQEMLCPSQITNCGLCPLSLSLCLQECCLCQLRGGALKATETGKWAHLVCGVSVPEVVLGDSRRKEPIILGGIPRARRKLVSVLEDFYVVESRVW